MQRHETFLTHTCQSQCDDCHDLNNCVEAVTRIGDLLLCTPCRERRMA